MPNVVGFKINSTAYEYDHDHLANIPTIDAVPTENSTNAIRSGAVYDLKEDLESAIAAISFDIVVDANGHATLERSDLTDVSEVSY